MRTTRKDRQRPILILTDDRQQCEAEGTRHPRPDGFPTLRLDPKTILTLSRRGDGAVREYRKVEEQIRIRETQ